MTFRKFQHGSAHFHTGKPFQHWYRDNTIYFITSTCRDHFPAFKSEETKGIFWNRFDYYYEEFGFKPWIASLMSTHYHVMGYLKKGESLGKLMQRVHGSVAKLVNDKLPERRKKFWVEKGRADYFDGCIRDETQCRRAYRYIERQGVRHGIVKASAEYKHTRVWIALEPGVTRALELKAFMTGVGYLRYDGDAPTR